MFTPATSASSTSSPRVMRPKASSTQVRGPPFLYLKPLAEEMTTGFTEVMTAGACPKAAPPPAPAARSPAVPVFTKSRRLTLWGIGLLSMADGATASLSRPFSVRWEVVAASPEHEQGERHRDQGPPFAIEPDAGPREAGGARAARSQPRQEGGDLARPGPERIGKARGQERGLAADGGRVESEEVDRARQRGPGTGGGEGDAGRHERAAEVERVARVRIGPARRQHPRLLDVAGSPDAKGFTQEAEGEAAQQRPRGRPRERDHHRARHPAQRDAEPRRQRRSVCPRPAGGRSPSGPLRAGSRA